MERCAHNAEKRLLMTDSGMTERGSNSPNYPIGHKKHLPLPSKQTALRKDPTKQPKKGALYFLSIHAVRVLQQVAPGDEELRRQTVRFQRVLGLKHASEYGGGSVDRGDAEMAVRDSERFLKFVETRTR